jgi:phage terminase large subunit
MYSATTATRKIKNLTKRIRIIQGGTGASKTVSILLLLVDLAQRDKEPTLASVVSESMPHLKKGCIRIFQDILKSHDYWEEEGWNATDKIYTFETGSQIEFFGADDSDKLRGPRRDRLFLNECNNISFAAFEELEVRTKEFIFLDFNPVAEFWAITDLKERPDIDHIVLTYKDNEALPETIVKSIEARKNRPGWWKVYGLGELGEVEGRIYTGFQIIGEIPFEARLERYGLDFGYHPDPCAAVAIYWWNGGYIIDEIIYQQDLKNREIADIFRNLPRALIVADAAEPKSIAEIKEFGLNIIPCEKGRDSRQYGIKLVQDQRISITKNSPNLIREYRNYLYKVDRNGLVIAGQPEDGNDHCLDAMRYGLVSLVPVQLREEARRNLAFKNWKSREKKVNPAL